MNAEPTAIAIELQTIIDNDGQLEYNTVKQSGALYQKGNQDILTFKETADDGTSIKNLITIHMNKVSIKRSGVVSMHQQFQVNQKTENVFKHPHGNIHMETFTDKMDYQAFSNQEDGLLTLDYSVKLNGQEARNQQLKLTINKEDSQ